jgi:hypothetical protein
VLAENRPMLKFCQGLNFDIKYENQDIGVCNVVKKLY